MHYSLTVGDDLAEHKHPDVTHPITLTPH